MENIRTPKDHSMSKGKESFEKPLKICYETLTSHMA